jgi:ABC-2 type transport system ATP-binding protein
VALEGSGTIISAHDLRKVFRIPSRQGGRLGAVRTLLTRDYELIRAVDGITFDIEAGELIGYIGPNGAGKSTTIKILTGILEPTSGDVGVCGVVPWRRREENARNIGVVFGQRSQLWWDLPLTESFELVGRMYGIEAQRYKQNLARFRALLDLDEFIDAPVRTLSLGQRMRGELTGALLHDPRVVYLDEPTIGLDVVAKERIRTFVSEINRERGTTVVLTTHDFADVERLCRRIILIDRGAVLFDGTVEALKAEYAPYRDVVVRLSSDPDEAMSFGELPGVVVVARDPGVVRVRFDPARVPVHVVVAAIAARLPVTDLSIVEPELESVVRDLYQARAGAQPGG